METEEMLEQMDEESTQQIVRLIQWLKDHGHTDEEAMDCIRYIAQ